MRRPLIHSVLLLLFFLTLRLMDVLSFPGFIDEHEHIRWAREVYETRFFAGASSGRLFGLWWMSVFGLQQDNALWLARASTALFNLVGAAVLFDLGRRLANLWTGSLIVLLASISPYTFFYERMGLTDSYVTVWALLAAWFALRTVRRSSVVDAAACGIATTAAFSAKATGITVAAIPGLILLLLAPRQPWRQRVRGIIISYGTFAAGFATFFGFLWWRGYRYLGAATTIVGTKDTTNALDRLHNGLTAIWKLDVDYLSLPFMVVAVFLAVYLLIRRRALGLVLLGSVLIPLGGILLFAVKYSARYFHFHVPFVLLLVALGLGQLAGDLYRRSRIAGFALWTLPLLLWGGLFALPFQRAYFDDPASLDLPDLDRLEYITSDASGFTLPEIADYLQTQAHGRPIVVVGLLANCGTLDYYLPNSAPIRLICPVLKWDGTHQPEVIALVNHMATEPQPLWIVFEESVYVTLHGINLPLTLETTFQRPDRLTLIEVFSVAGS
ncbi:MAG TPA: glycosyltransferase family 39 protein [Aggregatilineaceae bacterium]|nr:glycosyltransferase family 39 protein [Aggregatilineaceae bacterium]